MQTNKKKILITDYSVTKEILSNSSLLALIDSASSKNFNFLVVFNRDCDLNKELKSRGIKTHTCLYGNTNVIINVLYHLILPFSYAYIILKEKPDFIYANSVMASKSGVLFKFLSNKPLIIHIRNVGFFKRTKFFSLLADHFFCVSKYCLENTLPVKYWSKALVVYDGVDIEKFSKRANIFRQYNKSKKHIVFGMVGRIVEQKGQDYYVKLANNLSKKYPHLIFLHCGEIPDINRSKYESYLHKDTKKLIENKKFYWFEYSKSIEKFWAVVDIAIAPSQSDEALGRVILEAMASDIPIITTQSGGPEEIIKNNINGICIPTNNYSQLERNSINLIENKLFSEELAKNGKKTIDYNFSLRAYSKKVLSAIEAL
tara:strand:- start:407 stop:1522 length:1116 start_codon:yes stop_codon:yes gene_type:complete